MSTIKEISSVQWLIFIISPTLEVKTGRTDVRGQHRQRIIKIPSHKLGTVPSYGSSTSRWIMVPGQLWQKARSYLKNNLKQKGLGTQPNGRVLV
jgi:hypothetical protein